MPQKGQYPPTIATVVKYQNAVLRNVSASGEWQEIDFVFNDAGQVTTTTQSPGWVEDGNYFSYGGKSLGDTGAVFTWSPTGASVVYPDGSSGTMTLSNPVNYASIVADSIACLALVDLLNPSRLYDFAQINLDGPGMGYFGYGYETVPPGGRIYSQAAVLGPSSNPQIGANFDWTIDQRLLAQAVCANGLPFFGNDITAPQLGVGTHIIGCFSMKFAIRAPNGLNYYRTAVLDLSKPAALIPPEGLQGPASPLTPPRPRGEYVYDPSDSPGSGELQTLYIPPG